MGLNNVDVSCIGTWVATGLSTCAVSWGLRGDGGLEGWGEEEEKKKRRGGRGRPFILSRPTYLPKMDGDGVGLVASGLLDTMRHHPYM